MDDPRYGTHGPADIPVVQLPSGAGHARVLAGPYGADVKGPFKTVQPVQLVDYELAANQTVVHSVPQVGSCCRCSGGKRKRGRTALTICT